ncbi:MAG: uroporphyrinogen decarboxylase family protein [Anaerolineae bacterium]|jgi:MtaA/CmuA family methyltransferase|nr:uroporphyrinogen decarboxylase [Chloroflexota bacterium]
MNSLERTLARLAGKPVDRPPNFDILMQHAAHLIGAPLSRYYQDYRVLCDANMAALEAFDLDIVQAISDPYREAADFGMQITFPEDDLPLGIEPLLADPDNIRKLRVLEPSHGARMSDRVNAVAWFRERVGGTVPVMGWIEGAMAEAADLRGVSNLLMDLYDRPEWVRDLLEITGEQAIAFARAQIAAGADIIGMGESVASQVSPRVYERLVLPWQQRIFSAVREAGAIPRLHICGDTTRILRQMATSGAEIIDLDWMVDIEEAGALYNHYNAEGIPSPARWLALSGNQDPVAVMLQGTPEDVYGATLHCLEAMGPRGISNAGCEIPQGTPAENMHAQTRAIAAYGAAQGAQPEALP